MEKYHLFHKTVEKATCHRRALWLIQGKMCQQEKSSYQWNWSRRKVHRCQWSSNWGWLWALGLWNTKFLKCHAAFGYTLWHYLAVTLCGRLLPLDHSGHRIQWRLDLQTTVPGVPEGNSVRHGRNVRAIYGASCLLLCTFLQSSKQWVLFLWAERANKHSWEFKAQKSRKWLYLYGKPVKRPFP